MATVTALLREEKIDSKNPIYFARKENGLSLLQAAKALDTSPTKLEREELNPSGAVDVNKARTAYQLFVARNPPAAGKNLLFGSISLRIARDIMGDSVESFSTKYKISPSHWRKLECHAREIEPELLRQIEADVRKSFAKICNFSLS
jgi:hypothetical protein